MAFRLIGIQFVRSPTMIWQPKKKDNKVDLKYHFCVDFVIQIYGIIVLHFTLLLGHTLDLNSQLQGKI